VDRQIVYAGSIPLDTDLLSAQKNAMIAIGYLAQATLGSGTVVDGLACNPTAPASMTILIGPGSLATMSVIDATAYGSLPADSTDPLVKMGILTGATTFALTAPTVSGQSINYLVEATLSETDADPVVLPYYNAANPTQPFSGPQNDGATQNTVRQQRVQLQLKPSAPAAAGTQVTPPVDSGWVGLYVVTVNYGQTEVTPANITVFPGAPFIAFKLNTLTPGFSRIATYTGSGNFVVPIGSASVRVRLCGGGGGGGAGAPQLGGAGGGAGGYAEGIVAVQPGQVIPVIVGTGGDAGVAAGASAGQGGLSSFGTTISATGGFGGVSAATYAAGGAPGYGQGGAINLLGGNGSDGNGGTAIFAGNGGASYFGGGGRAAAGGGTSPQAGAAPGSGGGGCYGIAQNGGPGAAGIVIVEF
jgi:hypothetical protein